MALAQTTQVPLTSAWQTIGTGPLLVQVLSGSVLVLESASIPTSTETDGTLVTAAGVAGTTATKFGDVATYWAKAIATGSIVNVTPLPVPSAGVSSGSSGSPSAPQAVSELVLLQEVVDTLDAPAQDASIQALTKVMGAPAQDGADVAGATMPAGGKGIRGWLSAGVVELVAIASALGGTLKSAVQSNAPRVVGTGALNILNAAVTLGVDGMSAGVLQLTGIWAGTVSFAGSVDGGVTYLPIAMVPLGGGAAAESATGNGQWELACGCFTHLQARMSAYTSGSAMALLAAATGLKSVRVGNPSGNPLTISASDGGLATLGATTDAPTASGAATSVVGALRTIRDKLLATVAISGTVTANLGTLNGASTAAGQASALTALQTIAGATTAGSTATNQAAGNTLLTQIVALLQQTAAETLWTDNTGAYFIRLDNPTGGTPTWKNVDGNASAAPGAGAKPAADRTAPVTDKTAYQAIAAAAGIGANDFIDHFVTTDSVTGSIVGQFWLNSSQGAVLAAAPATSNLTALSLLPQGAATLAQQQAIAGLLQQALTTLGTPADAVATPASATGSAISWLRGIYGTIQASYSKLAAITTAITGTLTFASANPATIYSNRQTATLSAEPLPSQALVNGIVVTALSTNSGTIYVGGAGLTAANGYPLPPGQSTSYGVQNLSALWIIGTNTTDAVAFTGN